MTSCKLQELPSFELVDSVGDYNNDTACIMSAAVACYRLAKGEPLGIATDELECCCPVIRAFAINLNDSTMWQNNERRTQLLMPFVPRLVDTYNPALEMQRLCMIADRCVRTIYPIVLTTDCSDPETADKLRQLPQIDSEETAKVVFDKLRELKNSYTDDAYLPSETIVNRAITAANRPVAYVKFHTPDELSFWCCCCDDLGDTTRPLVLLRVLELLDDLIKLSEQTPAVVS